MADSPDGAEMQHSAPYKAAIELSNASDVGVPTRP